MKKRCIIGIMGLTVAVFAAVLWMYGSGRNFETVYYSIASPKTEQRIRIVVLSDLHNREFGTENQSLTDRILALKPDVIAVAGDMVTFGNPDIETASSLCRRLAEIAPVFYTFGNHENEMVYGSDLTYDFLASQVEAIGTDDYGTLDFSKLPMTDSSLPDALDQAGAVILNNKAAELSVKDCTVDILGIDNYSGTYFPYSYHVVEEALTENPQNIKIILSHQPGIPLAGISCQEDLTYDLAVSGHTHGGIIRIPGLGGMFREGKFWPWFTGVDAGLQKNSQGTVFISRGLGNSNWIPRLFNPPELAVIDIY